MARRRRIRTGKRRASRAAGPLALAALVLGLLLSACGGGSTATSTEAAETTGTGASEPGPGAFVSLGSVSKLGLVLVDFHGFTLYAFDREKTGKPSCYGTCTRNWLPLLTEGEPQPGNGASAAKLGTVRRREGRVQVTYAGRPLYTFAADRGPGEANGNGFLSFGGRWHAVKGSGENARE